ncbi:hypothetical protein LV779_00140 [Streptomyces thinghirensis]|nr:hypothetical protein [Streptomyces thinghirensis]
MRESAEAFLRRHAPPRSRAIVHQQNKELREMEEDHRRNPEVFDDLLRIDHGTALIGRLADSISVISPARTPVAQAGGTPGVLRGAMSRIWSTPASTWPPSPRVNIKEHPGQSRSSTPRRSLLDRRTPLLAAGGPRCMSPRPGCRAVSASKIEDAGISLSEESRARIEGLLGTPEARHRRGTSPTAAAGPVGRRPPVPGTAWTCPCGPPRTARSGPSSCRAR